MGGVGGESYEVRQIGGGGGHRVPSHQKCHLAGFLEEEIWILGGYFFPTDAVLAGGRAIGRAHVFGLDYHPQPVARCVFRGQGERRGMKGLRVRAR